MRLASRLLTALLGLALIWFLWPFGGSDEVVTAVSPPPAGQDGRLFTKSAAPPAKSAAPKTTPAAAGAPRGGPNGAPQKSAHAVPAPQGPAAQGGEQTAALSRDAAPSPTLKPKLFYRVVVRDGGTLKSAGTVITLGGIRARAADAKCKDKTGRTWACGARAKLALTRLIRGRAVICEVPVSGKQKALTARCTVGGKDLSIWMVDQGWAEAAAPADPKLAQATDAARERRVGLWR